MKIKLKTSRKSHEPESSAQTVASIDDLLTEILLRLPIKSLIRFKLVSKHWHSLITTPEFCLLRNPKPNPALGLFLPRINFRVNPRFDYIPFSAKNPTNPPFRKLKFTKDPSGLRILQSCNGLMLCSSFRARDHSRNYYVYNPTTKKFSTLPKLDVCWTSVRIHGMSLAFDPDRSPHYKVVCVRGFQSDSGEYEYQFEVYSSETGPWRKWGEPFTMTAHVNYETGVYWNGAVHWISNGAGDSLYLNLDDDDRMARVMPMPPIPNDWDWRSNSYFGESCGHLHYIELMGSQSQFDVHEMKRDYSEWFVKYRVDLSPVVAAYPGMIRDDFVPGDWYYYALSIFGVVRGEEDEDSFLVLQIPGRVIRYNVVDRSFETVHEFEDAEIGTSLAFPGISGFQYIESLCCV